MLEFMNWVLSFFKGLVSMIFSVSSSDGRSLGYTLLGVTIVGAVIMATIAAVGIFSRKR